MRYKACFVSLSEHSGNGNRSSQIMNSHLHLSVQFIKTAYSTISTITKLDQCFKNLAMKYLKNCNSE